MTEVSSLSGITVLEVGDGWTCALAGKLLMDMGAGVTKVEVPWGDALRSYGRDDVERQAAFALPNVGKQLLEGAAADERMRKGFDDVDVLIVDADTAARLGLDVAAVGPHAIVCRFAAFAPDGPLTGLAANDLTLQAISGVMDITGDPDRPPLRSGTELSNVLGALYGVIGVLAALIERERSAQGQLVDVFLYDCLVSTLTNFACRVLAGVEPLERLGNQGPNSAPWELFDTADDQYVFIIAASPPTFARLVATMGQPELLDDPRFANPHSRRENYQAVTAVVSDWTRSLPRDEIVAALRANGVPVSPVASISELLADPHSRSRGLLTRVADESGRTWLSPGPPLGFPRDPLRQADGRKPAPAAGDAPRTAPLSGVRVVDFGTLTAAPFCARLLANLGADVLKIEPPDGEAGRHMPSIVDGESTFFHISNNGKKSLRANLRDEADIGLVAKVLAQADIVVENQSPGALTKRGLGGERLLAESPSLIYTSVSGFGHAGVLGGLRAYDTVIQAAGGLMGLTGEEGGRPIKTGISSADFLGALAAAIAALGAYFGRITARHHGVQLDVALYDICAWSTQMAWVSQESTLEEPTRHGNGHWLFAPYGVFDTQDGRRLAIACETDAQWQALAGLLATAGLGALPAGADTWSRSERWNRRGELEELLRAYCGARTLDTVFDELQPLRVPCGEVLTVEDVLTTRQQVARTTVQTIPVNDKVWTVTDIPIRLSATPAAVTTPAPPLGGEDEHIREHPDKAWEHAFDNEDQHSVAN